MTKALKIKPRKVFDLDPGCDRLAYFELVGVIGNLSAGETASVMSAGLPFEMRVQEGRAGHVTTGRIVRRATQRITTEILMDHNTLVIVLAVVTIGIALFIGIWQRGRAAQAKRNNEHSAVTTGKAEPKP